MGAPEVRRRAAPGAPAGAGRRTAGAAGPSRREGHAADHADDDRTEGLFVDSLRRLVDAAGSIGSPSPVRLPEPHALELEQAMLPRKAFFAAAEHVQAEEAVGRVAAETLSPYPPGVPAVVPGEVVTAEVVDYLRSGVAAGMLVPDAADPTLGTLRVTAR